MSLNIPQTDKKRIVIIGGGFAGLYLVKNLTNTAHQIVLLDENNYHKFSPLLYQVATAGLEPDAVASPFRKIFHGRKNVHFRMAQLKSVDISQNLIHTNQGNLDYDILVLAVGTTVNYFGMDDIRQHALSLKTLPDAIQIRHRLLAHMEKANLTAKEEERQSLMNVVIVGAGPTGVETAGAIAELRHHILPKDYPDLDFQHMQIYLAEMKEKTLPTMSAQASDYTQRALEKKGIRVLLDHKVQQYDGNTIEFSTGKIILSRLMLWTSGVTGQRINGLPERVLDKMGCLEVNQYNQLKDIDNVFAIGDIARMKSKQYPKGYPMLAPVAIQQAKHLAGNLLGLDKKEKMVPFQYKDRGMMTTIGRNQAITQTKRWTIRGFFAWVLWLYVHLIKMVGFRNKLTILINWAWNYLTYDRGVRFVIQLSCKDDD